ncbi:hypothetical protein [Castellaniella defragrans]|uniref:Uncharacterized protein n=1 Tax=Castellaniella defragrans TaxID=75697 RepID=A0A7W9WNL7_CASDE|nr:hypothetical protein [Castellaniella defragrans]MBB6083901.1 hypothetical protein [Castellaniella defragrans]
MVANSVVPMANAPIARAKITAPADARPPLEPNADTDAGAGGDAGADARKDD